ncbi:hypothetical protein ACLOJK_016302 [Asimina triloba]
MGYDPITHRPRTDLLATLPQLIALASMKEMLDQNQQYQWEEQTVMMQEAVQLARYQYMQYLLESTAMMSGTPNTLSDIDAVNLMNSISPSNASQLENAAQSSGGITTMQLPPLNENQTIPISHQPDLQFQCNLQAPINSSTETDADHSNYGAFGNGDRSTLKSPTPPPSFPPHDQLITDNTISNVGSEGCIASANGAGLTPPFWNELFLDDPFLLQEFA